MLLGGVLLVRDSTAVDAADLAPLRGEAEPAATASAGADAQEAVLLTANGLPGLRLGAAPGEGLQVRSEALEASAEGEEGPVPCDAAYPAYGPLGDGTLDVGPDLDSEAMQRLVQRVGLGAWLVDGRVASVRVSAWEDPTQLFDVLRSWSPTSR